MKEQKNIERLFQEKFKDFEATPPQDSWEIIASKLNEKKKKKRVLPFWFQFSGIAASLFITSTLVWNYQFKNDVQIQDTKNSVVFETPKDEKNNENDVSKSVNENLPITYSVKDEANESVSSKNKLEENINQNKISNNSLHKSKNTIVSNKKEKSNLSVSLFENSNAKVVDNSEGNKISKNKKKTVKINSGITSKDELIHTEFTNNRIIANQKNKTNSNSVDSETMETFFENENKQAVITNDNTLENNNNSKTIVTSKEIIINDSTLVAKIAEKNPLEELLTAKEVGENEGEKEKRSKWAINSNAAPVYFNSIAEGSSLDAEFKNNSKSYTTSLSYGIGGSYSVSSKISIRAGINNINLSYNTNDVVYQTKLDASINNNIPVISRNSNGSNVTFSSKSAGNNALNGDVENVAINNLGAIKQELSYIEVPVEMSYKIVDKKFGIEVIGGMSTLFLNNNDISLVTDGMQMSVGKANNLNNIHFSSNVGLGFKYSFWKNFNANFQPMFKYQINTFSENSGNFKPYFIGLYSGISFSF